MWHQLLRTFTPMETGTAEHNTGQEKGKMVKADDHKRFLGGMMRHFQAILAAVGLISVMAAGLKVLSWRLGFLVIVTGIVKEIFRPDIGQTMVRTVVTGCINLAGHLPPAGGKTPSSLLVSEYGAIGAALGGAVGGAIGGVVYTLLGEVLPVFGQAIGVALGVVFGRIFGQIFTNEILKRNAITDKGIAGPLGGALAGGFGALFGFMAGGVIGGFTGALLGAAGGKYLGNWLKETSLGGMHHFISVLSTIAVGLITSIRHITTLFGVIGLLGSLLAILAMILTKKQQKATHNSTNKKAVDDTSTNKEHVKGKHNTEDGKKEWIKLNNQKRVWQYCELMLSAVGLITIMLTGVMAILTLITLAVVAAVLELFRGGYDSKSLTGVVTAAKGIMGAAVTGCGHLAGLLKQIVGKKVVALVFSEYEGDACTIGGAIGGAVGGAMGGAVLTFLSVIHPVFGQSVGGVLGAILGWTISKAFTTDILTRHGKADNRPAGAVGGAIGGNIGAFFGFLTGGVVGGLAGGVIGMMGDTYLGVRSDWFERAR
ncbi:uncharacterized protein LOC134070039 [Sardina pilchardus]|uniref:uncharacterized protein LOC134070039 n=1 Tax=Sardina pilchardus TaxID=27697 RepID=UPI002E0FCC59